MHYGRLEKNGLRVDAHLPNGPEDPEQSWDVQYSLKTGTVGGKDVYLPLTQKQVPLEIPPYEIGVQQGDLDNVEKEIRSVLKALVGDF